MISSVDDLEAAIRDHLSSGPPPAQPAPSWRMEPEPQWEDATGGGMGSPWGGGTGKYGSLAEAAPHLAGYLEKNALLGTVTKGVSSLLGRGAARAAAPIAGTVVAKQAPGALSRIGDIAGLGLTASAVPAAMRPVQS